MNDTTIRTISPKEAEQLLRQEENSCVLIDVRTPGEFASLRATPATNLPIHTISADSIKQLEGKKVICICQKGTRGAQAANMFFQNGLRGVCNVAGGTEAWENAGLPVIQGRACMSLERQVRIAAGLLVLIGVIGGYSITPNLFLLSAFVGGGLVFSGLTNTCGMGVLLAQCPWNSK